MPLIKTLAGFFMSSRLKRLEKIRAKPDETQASVFKDLISNLSQTEFGHTHKINSNTSEREFGSKIPLQEYETIYPWIEKCLKGEKNILWPGEVTWFSKSSGTTNDRSKYIPVTHASLHNNHFKGGRDMVAAYLASQPSTRIFEGKQLSLGGNLIPNPYRNNSFIGDVSAVLIRNLPAFYEYFRCPDRAIALMDDWEPKIEKLAAATMNLRVASAAGVPSWMLLLFRTIMEMKGAKNMHEVWPGFEVFFHGGVSFDPYRESYHKIFPDKKINLVETYNASEGFFSFQDSPVERGMLLLTDHGIYYEFIPLDSAGGLAKDVVPLSAVETGKQYAIVISTNGGLWRYMPGDTIRFTSVYPHRIVVSGRTKHFINLFGEELMVENADRGIDAACKASGAEMENYCAGPVFFKESGTGKHVWLIEFKTYPEDLDVFARILDESLQNQNSDYAAKRQQNLLLGPPEIKAVPAGTFLNWLKEKNRLGAQAKIQRLSNSEEWIREFLMFAEQGNPKS